MNIDEFIKQCREEKGWSAQAFCSKENQHKVMDVVLCLEFERLANARIIPLLDKLEEAMKVIRDLREALDIQYELEGCCLDLVEADKKAREFLDGLNSSSPSETSHSMSDTPNAER